MAFKQLVHKNERRFANHISAFICVYLRLKKIKNYIYQQNFPAPISGFNSFSNLNLR